MNLENEKRGNVVKCPNCGAPIEAGVGKCKECGYVFTNVKAISSAERFAKEMSDLRSRLNLTRDKDTAEMVSFINSFPIPSGKEDLIEFIASMDASRRGTQNNNAIQVAFNGKYKECVTKAKAVFPDDPQVQTAISVTDKFFMTNQAILNYGCLCSPIIFCLIYWLFSVLI